MSKPDDTNGGTSADDDANKGGDGTGTGDGSGDGKGNPNEDTPTKEELEAARQEAADAKKALNDAQSEQGRKLEEAKTAAVEAYKAEQDLEKAKKDGDNEKVIADLQKKLDDANAGKSEAESKLEATSKEAEDLKSFKDERLNSAKEKNEETEKALLKDLDEDAKANAEKMIKGFSDDPFTRQEQLSGLRDMLKTQSNNRPGYDPKKGGNALKEDAAALFGGKKKDK